MNHLNSSLCGTIWKTLIQRNKDNDVTYHLIYVDKFNPHHYHQR